MIVYATGYNITFPFFDADFISAPDNRLSLYKRMFKPGIDDLVFIGFAPGDPDAVPVRRVPGAAAGALPGRHATGRRPRGRDASGRSPPTTQRYVGHYADTPRHTQQVDYFVYEYEMRTRELPEGCSARSRPGRRRERPGRAEIAARQRQLTFGRRRALRGVALTRRRRRPAARPCVVMAHGFGGTRDCGLERLRASARRGRRRRAAASTTAASAHSDGEPRQLVSPRSSSTTTPPRSPTPASAGRRRPRADRRSGARRYAGGHVFQVAAATRASPPSSRSPAPDGLRR